MIEHVAQLQDEAKHRFNRRKVLSLQDRGLRIVSVSPSARDMVRVGVQVELEEERASRLCIDVVSGVHNIKRALVTSYRILYRMLLHWG